MKKLILFAFSAALLFSGCINQRTGNFQLFLTDQPIDNAEQILVSISSISVQKEEEGFLTLWEDLQNPRTYDLIALRDQEEKIADVTLEEGTYTQIRLVVVAGEIVFEGESHQMTVPNSEVIIPVIFEIKEEGATQIILDFEAEQSIHEVRAGESGQYILRPVVRTERVTY